MQKPGGKNASWSWQGFSLWLVVFSPRLGLWLCVVVLDSLSLRAFVFLRFLCLMPEGPWGIACVLAWHAHAVTHCSLFKFGANVWRL